MRSFADFNPLQKDNNHEVLQHIDLKDLKRSDLKVRKHGGGDVADLVHSIKRLGVLQRFRSSGLDRNLWGHTA